MVTQLAIPESDVSSPDGGGEIISNQREVASVDVVPYRFESFAPSRNDVTAEYGTTNDLSVRVELGRTRMHLEDALQLKAETLVPLDAPANAPMDVYIDGRLAARGELLAVDGCFSIRVIELIS